jgi:hypothetical protein
MISVINPAASKEIQKRLDTQQKFLDLFLQYFKEPTNLKTAKDFIPNNIYHSVSFSNHENYTKLYEEERNQTTLAIRKTGWDIWAPYEKTDPGKLLKRFNKNTTTNHGHSAQEIADIDFARILKSEVLLLDLNLSSNGIGQETQIGFFIPKIVYTRKRPSMLTGGIPGTLPIFYDDYDELKKILIEIFSRKSYETEPFYIKNEHIYKGEVDLNKKYKDKLWNWN